MDDRGRTTAGAQGDDVDYPDVSSTKADLPTIDNEASPVFVTCSCPAKGRSAMSSCVALKPHAVAAASMCSVLVNRRPCHARGDSYEQKRNVWSHAPQAREEQGVCKVIRLVQEHTDLYKLLTVETASSHLAIALGGPHHQRQQQQRRQLPQSLARSGIAAGGEGSSRCCGGLLQAADPLAAAPTAFAYGIVAARFRRRNRRLKACRVCQPSCGMADAKALQQPGGKSRQLWPAGCDVPAGQWCSASAAGAPTLSNAQPCCTV